MNIGLTCEGTDFVLGVPHKFACCTMCHENEDSTKLGSKRRGGHTLMWYDIPFSAVCPDGELRREQKGFLCCTHRALVDNVSRAGGWERLRMSLVKTKSADGLKLNGTIGELLPTDPGYSRENAAAWVASHPSSPSCWLGTMHPCPTGMIDASMHPLHVWYPDTVKKSPEYLDLPIQLFTAEGVNEQTVTVCQWPGCKYCAQSSGNYWSWKLQAWVNKNAYAELDRAFSLSQRVLSIDLAGDKFAVELDHAIQDPSADCWWVAEYDLHRARYGPGTPSKGNHLFPYYMFDPTYHALVRMGPKPSKDFSMLKWFVASWGGQDYMGYLQTQMKTFKPTWAVHMAGAKVI